MSRNIVGELSDDYVTYSRTKNPGKPKIQLDEKEDAEGKKHRQFTRERGSAGFKCSHCGMVISAASKSDVGTNHRNHCPFCLRSSHVDEKKSGDRKSSCKAGMRPVGITLKVNNNAHSASPFTGEPMIVFSCTGCGEIRCNRCAGDDDGPSMAEIFFRYFVDDSPLTRGGKLQEKIMTAGIYMAGNTLTEARLVLERIFGRGGIPQHLEERLSLRFPTNEEGKT